LHSFVVVVKKPNRQIPHDVLVYLQRNDTADLCFVATDHLFWMDDVQQVAFAGWSAITRIGDIGSYWYADDYGLTAFAGRMWPRGRMWQRGETWANQLAYHWRSHPVVDEKQVLGGIYSAVSITRNGTGRIVSDPLSIAMIYRAENDDVVVYSTSARLAARVSAYPDEPQRDPWGIAWLPFLGWMIGDRTGYVSTRVLPLGVHVEVAPAYGSRVRFTNATPWASDVPSREAELIDLVHGDLSASVRSVSQIPAPNRVANITGGKDSRLVLALMLQEGVAEKFEFNTSGYEHSPDPLVAHQISERFRLTHTAPVPRPLPEEEFRRRLATHVFQTSGMFNAWEFKGSLRISPTLTVTGCVGEALRTHFHGYPRMSTVDDLRVQFFGRSALRGSSIMKPEVRSELLDHLDAELVHRVDAGGSSPQDLADSFYWRHRNRRWFGTYEELGEAGRVHPLYSLVGLQAAFALGGESRRNELLHFAIMRKACPDLAKVPFADEGWSEAIRRSLPDGRDYGRAPVRYEGKGPEPEQWKPQRLLDNLDVAHELLLDETSSPLYDIVDRDAVQRVLAMPEQATPATCRQLFGALTAAVWLGGYEARDRIGGQPTRLHDQAPAPTAAMESATLATRIRRALHLGRGVSPA
jgi:hypothetical protein